ncbi:helix-turn-helix transcriptional regulator [Erwinia sp. HR93]|uniref:helix-turn-helix transcriptional regulator n=1 Tax=Erwinia sp. HR93 TaxID=3094840 RepID=UPI002ADEA898|nr:LuxR C-terminal-related transcriptional regulator [Erwinia sp. HR93]MEA1062950.1 LuxR C-terminal-related transcriptional regulator [Erwinia sp. HR93]
MASIVCHDTVVNIYGQDRFYICGVQELLTDFFAVFTPLKNDNSSLPDFWVLPRLLDVCFFVQKADKNKKSIIFCLESHMRILSNLRSLGEIIFVPIYATVKLVNALLFSFFVERKELGFSATNSKQEKIPETITRTLALLLSGMPPKRISHVRNIDIKTVSLHKRIAMSELNVVSLPELVVKAWALGLDGEFSFTGR